MTTSTARRLLIASLTLLASTAVMASTPCTVDGDCAGLDHPPGIEAYCNVDTCAFRIQDGSEVLTNMQHIYMGAQVYRSWDDRRDTDGGLLGCQYPVSQGVTPLEMTCCSPLGGPDGDMDGRCDSDPDLWATPTWSNLGIRLGDREDPSDQHSYLYDFAVPGGAGAPFEFRMRADHEDCDESGVWNTCQYVITVRGVESGADPCTLAAPATVDYSFCDGETPGGQTGTIALSASQQAGMLAPASAESVHPGWGEVDTYLDAIVTGAADYYADHCAWPANQGITPVEASCCSALGGPDTDGDDVCDINNSIWNTPAWNAVGFSIVGVHSYVYAMENDGSTFTASAYGDTDCDTVQATFKRFATITSASPPCAAQVTSGTFSNRGSEGCDDTCFDFDPCGDGDVDEGEDCDDGEDGDDLDGCRDDCSYTCATDADCEDFDVPPGVVLTCEIASHTCAPSLSDDGEPLQNLQRLYKGLRAYMSYEERLTSTGAVAGCSLPDGLDAGVNPIEGTCCPTLGGPDANGNGRCDNDTDVWAQAPWNEIGFVLGAPGSSAVTPEHDYVYEIDEDATDRFHLKLKADNEDASGACVACQHGLTLEGVPGGDDCSLGTPTEVAFSFCDGTTAGEWTGAIALSADQQAGFATPDWATSANSMWSEAYEHLDQIIDGAVVHYNDHGAWPTMQGITPLEMSCCSTLGGPDEDGDDLCDADPDIWATPAWESIGFAIGGSHAFVYEMGAAGGGDRFEARAYGDQDCDTVQSTFVRFATRDGSVAQEVAGVFTEREAEGTPDQMLTWITIDEAGSSAAATTPVAADGASRSTISLTLLDADGEAVAGRTIAILAHAPGDTGTPLGTVFDADDGNATVRTDANGQAVAYLTSDTAQTVELSFTDSLSGTTLATTPQVVFQAVTPEPEKTTTNTGGESFTTGSATSSGTVEANLTNVEWNDPDDLPDEGKPDEEVLEMSLGVLNLTALVTDSVTGDPVAGQTVAFTITYPIDIPTGTPMYKFGPTADDHSPHWYEFTGTVEYNVDGDAKTVRVHVTDGGLGDADLEANGTIIDPIGPALPNPAAIPTLGEWALILLALALVAIAVRRLRAGGPVAAA